jgi:hypothetical protein
MRRESSERRKRSDRMSDESPVGLGLLAHQQRRIITGLGGLRDDMQVLTTIVLRQDGTLTALLDEVRAMHSQHGRLANRVRDLETR